MRPLFGAVWQVLKIAARDGHTCQGCAHRDRRVADLERRLNEAEELADARKLLLTAFDKNARRIENGKSN